MPKSEIFNVSMPTNHRTTGAYHCKVGNDIYYIGGYGKIDGVLQHTNKVSIFNIETSEWRDGTPLPFGVSNVNPTKAPYINGKIYIICGYEQTSSSSSATVSSKVLIYDIEGDEYSYGEERPWKSIQMGVATLNDDIYVLGGVSTSTISNSSVTKYGYHYKYNATANTWTKLANFKSNNNSYYFLGSFISCAFEGKIYSMISWGYGTNSSSIETTTNSASSYSYVSSYSPTTNTWTHVNFNNNCYANGGSLVPINTSIYLINGTSSSNALAPSNETYNTTIYRINSGSTSISSFSKAPYPTNGCAAVPVNGRIYLLGGYNGDYISSIGLHYTDDEPFVVDLYWKNPKQSQSSDIPSVTNVSAIPTLNYIV